MEITVQETGALVVLRLMGRGQSAALPALERMCQARARAGARGLLLDLAGVTRWSKGGLAALVDLVARWPLAVGQAPTLGLCGLDRRARMDLSTAGLDRVLPLYDSVAQAQAATPFATLRLAGLSAVVLCGAGREAGPLGEVTPPALLDVLGRPILGRLFDHLAGHGLSQTVVVSAPEVTQRVRRACGTGAGQGLARMAGLAAFHMQSAATRSAAALTALQEATGAVDAETVVVTAPCVTNMDLAALMAHHRAAGAPATLAMAQGADGTMRPSGVSVLTPEAVEALAAREARDRTLDAPLPQDLAEALARADLPYATWASPAQAITPDSPRAYMALLTALLQDRMPGQAPVGERLAGGLWMAPGADLGRRTRIDGPAWVGPAAVVEAGARLAGPAVIGAGARVSGQSLLRNGMLWAGAEMQPGAVVDGMIAAADWAVSHRLAKGQPVVDLPLDQVAGVPTRPVARPAEILEPVAQSA